ncbi:MAG: SpoIIE family protein phosphatase [Candidatus Riflebacteria bacterium]|nr:SpoIIE family protein phosphatase [Candidatus Riflebacteria bacterium]
MFLCFLLVIILIIFLPQQTDRVDRIFQDFAKRNLAPFFASSSELAVVAIDTETLDGIKQRWPWSRAKFAEFFELINSFKPRVIILDIVFQQPEESDGGYGDAVLEEMIKNAGNIALVGFIEEELTESGRRSRQFRSLKRFRDVAWCDGYIHSFTDSDARIRTFSIRDSKLDEESCQLKVVKKLEPGYETLGRMPDRSHIIFAGKNGGIPLLRGLDLMSGEVSGEFLKDKIVIVGATAIALHDYHQTCLGLMSGPQILAATMDTILTGRISAPVDGFLVRLLLAAVGVLLSYVFASRKRFVHELFDVAVFFVLLLLTYHLLALLLIFPPLSCLFLTWAFVSVSYSLVRRFIELIEQQISKAEAELAGKIQGELFPEKFIENDNYSIRGVCMPCDATGGDFFDYFEMADKNLLFVMGDVAGHGFSAAMLTVMAKTTIQLLRQKEMVSPEAIVSTLNQIIFELVKKKKFMTLAVGHIDVETHKLNLVLAGHLPPVVIDRDGNLQELKKAGFPMGVIKNLPIQAVHYDMQHGDSIVLFTDGIVEALDWNDEQYSFPNWYEFLRKIMPDFTRDRDLSELLAGVNEHKKGRSFDDDVTYVVVRREGPPAKK